MWWIRYFYFFLFLFFDGKRETNGCADLLAKWGTRQQPLVCVYSSCPTFGTIAYIRDLTGLGETRLRTPGAADDVIWTSFYLTPYFIYIYIYIKYGDSSR